MNCAKKENQENKELPSFFYKERQQSDHQLEI